MPQTLSDKEVHSRLSSALKALGTEKAKSDHCNIMLNVARSAVGGLLAIINNAAAKLNNKDKP